MRDNGNREVFLLEKAFMFQKETFNDPFFFVVSLLINTYLMSTYMANLTWSPLLSESSSSGASNRYIDICQLFLRGNHGIPMRVVQLSLDRQLFEDFRYYKYTA